MPRALTAALVALAATATVLTTLAPVSAVDGKPTGNPAVTDQQGRAEVVASAALARARSALAGASAAGPHGTDVTLALRDLRLSLPDLSASDRARAQLLLARPYAGQALCTVHFCVHYAQGYGTLAEAQTTAATMESVWAFEVTRLGYRPPAPDGTAGGDSRFDVYLANIGGQGLYGYTVPEAKVPGQAYRYSAYMVLDNDFAEFPLPGDPSRRVTAAHEFFHAIQFNYDAAEDQWILEATAVWMEEQYATDVNDNRQYLPYGQLDRPGEPLDEFDTSTFNYYGNWVFFQRLSQKYGSLAIRQIWQLLDATTGARDAYSVQGINRYLRAQGTTLREFYSDFAAGNLLPALVYDEGSAYRGGAASLAWRVGKGKSRATDASLDHLTARTYAARPGVKLGSRWRLRVVLAGPKRSSGAGAFVQVVLRSGAVERRLVHLKVGGNRRLSVPFGHAQVKRVLVTISNAGIRYDCYTGQEFACSGTPLSDGKTWSVRVTSFKGQ